MFKYVFPIALVAFAVVVARPQDYDDVPAAQEPQQQQQYDPRQNEVYVVNSTYTHEGAGRFYSLEIKSDGSRHEQRGFFKNGAQVIIGTYTNPDETGKLVTVNYVADRYGFHPSGDHLPSPPPPEVL